MTETLLWIKIFQVVSGLNVGKVPGNSSGRAIAVVSPSNENAAHALANIFAVLLELFARFHGYWFYALA